MYIGPNSPLTGKNLLRMLRPAKSHPFPGTICTFMGRDALSLAVFSLGLKGRDAVLLPAYLCREVLIPFREKTKVRFYDLKPDLVADPGEIKSKLAGGEVKLVVVINYFGFLQPHRAEIKRICTEKGVVLLEDCAHSLLTEGSGETGDLVLYSFRKILPLSEGGGLKIDFKEKTVKFSFYPRFAADCLSGLIILKSYLHLRSEFFNRGGLFSRVEPVFSKGSSAGSRRRFLPMSGFARRGMANSPLAEIREKRRRNFQAWQKLINRTEIFVPLFKTLPPEVCPLGFPVKLKARDRLVDRLQEKGIHLKVHWPLPEAVGGEFLNSRELSARLVTLPVYPELRQEEIEKIYDCLL